VGRPHPGDSTKSNRVAGLVSRSGSQTEKDASCATEHQSVSRSADTITDLVATLLPVGLASYGAGYSKKRAESPNRQALTVRNGIPIFKDLHSRQMKFSNRRKEKKDRR